MKKSALVATAAAAVFALSTIASTSSDARPFGGRGGGWHGGWHGGHRGFGWGPGIALGAAAVGVAAATSWGYPGYGYYGGYYPAYGYGYGAYPDGCLRQVWWYGAWRWQRVC